ncbi:hypothetical protein DEI81_13770 [Curtobacterium sp. MCBD17_013]|nr:hypothetical protein DEI81_13770 [Curtobacterium sp. MCBD17_013]
MAAKHHHKKKNAYSHWGSFTPVKQSGTSDGVVPLPAKAKYGIVTATYTGSDNFIVNGIDSANQVTTDGLVNTIGAYSGTTAFGLTAIGNPSKSLQVTATGPWTITISPIKSAPKLPTSGSHDGVFRYSGKVKTWAITNQGESNFIVTQYTRGAVPNGAVNEIGNYSGSVPALAGPSVVVVQSDGSWGIK